MQEILEFIKVYGFPAVIVVLVLMAAYKIIWKIVCSWIDNMNANTAALTKSLEAANIRWQAVVEKVNASIEKHTQDSKEAHFYTRAEHKNITDQQELITGSLKGIQEAVGRINGYTKPKEG
jgi:hypothetical protein